MIDRLLGAYGEIDPISHAGLSPEQIRYMEPFMAQVRKLKDARGLRIMFHMDNWLVAQMVRALVNQNGELRLPEEILKLEEWTPP